MKIGNPGVIYCQPLSKAQNIGFAGKKKPCFKTEVQGEQAPFAITARPTDFISISKTVNSPDMDAKDPAMKQLAEGLDAVLSDKKNEPLINRFMRTMLRKKIDLNGAPVDVRFVPTPKGFTTTLITGQGPNMRTKNIYTASTRDKSQLETAIRRTDEIVKPSLETSEFMSDKDLLKQNYRLVNPDKTIS